MDPNPPSPPPSPSIFRWTLGFLLIGAAWGLTTPFMRRAAMKSTPIAHPAVTDANNSWAKRKMLGLFWAVVDLLRTPSYAIPLLLNVTGSVWFFLLIGKAGTLAFLMRFWKGVFAGLGDVDQGDLRASQWSSGGHVLMRDTELSLTVPITNSLAFLFTVLGEWWAEGKVISRGTSDPERAEFLGGPAWRD
ncbi:hypothetical protein LTR04_000641 [Oleoguttula sp. CCFEE 6159]|nr:hypothetical protein LTR04_000641 [Oleoguttula sp. CCFEE 6159]